MRILRRIAVVVVVLLIAGFVGLRLRFGEQADIGAGFGAKHLCSCVFVGGRDYDACRRDLGPDMEPVRSALVGDTVEAWVPLLARRTARFHDGTGCTFE